jgi:hypothetical protein
MAGPSISECFESDGEPRFIHSIRIVIKIPQKDLGTLQNAALRGGHPRTSAGRFGEKSTARCRIALLPSLAPYQRVSIVIAQFVNMIASHWTGDVEGNSRAARFSPALGFRWTTTRAVIQWYQPHWQAFKLFSKYRGFCYRACPLFGRAIT